MSKEKFKINLAAGMEKAEVIVREVSEVNELKVKAPVKVNILGVIGAPFEFLSKRIDQPDQINKKRCLITFNRETLTIKLVTNEHDEYTSGTITGKLQQHPKFKEFGINSGKQWEPNELGQFFKMNRAFFADKTENMQLVTDLLNFEAKINTSIEKQKSEKGDFKDNYSGAVTANIPGKFKLNIPLFKGRPTEEVEVEFYASVNGRTILLQLYSPGANQALEDIRDMVIDEQISSIRELAPEIAIIEE